MPKYYRARETAREDEIDGLPLATFSRRAAGFGIDFVLVLVLRKWAGFIWDSYVPHQWERHTLINFPHVIDVIVLVVYFCLAHYVGNGQTVGKRLMRTRAISLTHQRMTLWQSLERSLGYGASFLEGGFGFAQFFTQRNQQCAHDRLAETVVIDERSAPPLRVDPAAAHDPGAGNESVVDPAAHSTAGSEISGSVTEASTVAARHAEKS
jgi:uncharacterized RDD family membrane protein YckC